MLDIKIHEYEKEVKRQIKWMEDSGRLMIDVHAKLQPLGLVGYVDVLQSWAGWPILIWLKNEEAPVEYSCGIVAEIERVLDLEKEMKMGTYADIGRVEYRGEYKGHSLVVFHFPKDTCVWVETGEEEIVKKKKLVCS